MRMKLSPPPSWTIAAILLLVSCSTLFAAEEPVKFTAEQVGFFEREVEPILRENCFKCHGNNLKKLRGGLYLKSRAGLLRGGDIGDVIDLANPDKSYILKQINYVDPEHQMPPSGKLPQKQIDTLTRWVKMGAPWSPDTADGLPLELLVERGGLTDEDRAYWAYQRVKRPDVPRVSDAPAGWSDHAIDAFILAKLRAVDLKPNTPASKATLVRRVYYDLTGLPPTPAQVRAFVKDNDPKAYEKLIDELLASPHYGEKWGRHWLDIVRYAETNSFERDGIKPNIWRYRDYVIRAFNEDKPYDQFIREQLAGDELANVTPDSITATGFYRLGQWDDEPADRPQAYFDTLDDILATTGQAMLGLSLNCSRCHDHKIDPLPQKDYYQMVAFFRNIAPQTRDPKSLLTPIASPQQIEAAKAENLKKINAEISQLEARVVDTFSNPEKEDAKAADVRAHMIAERYKKTLNDRDRKRYEQLLRERKNVPMPKVEMAITVKEFGGNAKDTFVLARGSVHAPTDKVEPGYPEVLGFDPPKLAPPANGAKTLGRRRVLADWIASPDNPLTARVMVNRLWQHHFGRGIVRTSNDFGKLGEMPTHPALLDWLAAEFVARKWSIKQMHRVIMTSAAYRMSSADNSSSLAADPANNLFWRFNMRRLTAEEIRDSILAVNGTLNLQQFGPWVYTKIPDAVKATASRPNNAWGNSPPDQQVRRSVYVHVKRSVREPFLASFDSADTDTSCPVRFTTTVPTQSLTMLNSDFIHEQAALFATRLRKEAPNDARKQVAIAVSLVTQREATNSEIDRGIELMQRLQNDDGIKPDKALDAFCLLSLNLNEFIYLD